MQIWGIAPSNFGLGVKHLNHYAIFPRVRGATLSLMYLSVSERSLTVCSRHQSEEMCYTHAYVVYDTPLLWVGIVLGVGGRVHIPSVGFGYGSKMGGENPTPCSQIGGRTVLRQLFGLEEVQSR